MFSALAGKALVGRTNRIIIRSSLFFGAVGILIGVYFVVFGSIHAGSPYQLFMNGKHVDSVGLFAFGPAGMQRAALY